VLPRNLLYPPTIHLVYPPEWIVPGQGRSFHRKLRFEPDL